jgi:hypothetical protein
MAIVYIAHFLEKEINKKFKKESIKIFSLIYSLEQNPKKGDIIGSIGNILIKEIKYNKFRFYFITDNFKIKFLKTDELNDLIIKFIRMSDKKDQQKTIEEIKNILRKLGKEGF